MDRLRWWSVLDGAANRPGGAGRLRQRTINSGPPPPKIQLSAGDYYFQELKAQDDSVIEITSGPVRIFVSGRIEYRGPFLNPDGTLAEVYVGYTGTDDVILEAPFLGQLVAPNARLEMGRADALEFRGQFFAQTIWLRPGVRLICRGC